MKCSFVELTFEAKVYILVLSIRFEFQSYKIISWWHQRFAKNLLQHLTYKQIQCLVLAKWEEIVIVIWERKKFEKSD